jgi:hypothetical protein
MGAENTPHAEVRERYGNDLYMFDTYPPRMGPFQHNSGYDNSHYYVRSRNRSNYHSSNRDSLNFNSPMMNTPHADHDQHIYESKDCNSRDSIEIAESGYDSPDKHFINQNQRKSDLIMDRKQNPRQHVMTNKYDIDRKQNPRQHVMTDTYDKYSDNYTDDRNCNLQLRAREQNLSDIYRDNSTENHDQCLKVAMNKMTQHQLAGNQSRSFHSTDNHDATRTDWDCNLQLRAREQNQYDNSIENHDQCQKVAMNKMTQHQLAGNQSRSFHTNDNHDDNKTGGGYKRPVDNFQGLPVNNFQGLPVDSFQGLQANNFQGLPANSFQGLPVNNFQGLPVDNCLGQSNSNQISHELKQTIQAQTDQAEYDKIMQRLTQPYNETPSSNVQANILAYLNKEQEKDNKVAPSIKGDTIKPFYSKTNKHRAEIQKFTGQDSNFTLSDFEIYLDQQNVYQHWTENEKLEHAFVCLAGPALHCIADSGFHADSWESLKATLKTALEPEGSEAKYLDELNRLCMEPKDTLQVWSEKVRRLGKLAYPDIPEKPRESMLVKKFCDGLNNEHVTRAVAFQHVRTLQGALWVAASDPNPSKVSSLKKPTVNIAQTEVNDTDKIADKLSAIVLSAVEKTEQGEYRKRYRRDQTPPAKFNSPDRYSKSQSYQKHDRPYNDRYDSSRETRYSNNGSYRDRSNSPGWQRKEATPNSYSTYGNSRSPARYQDRQRAVSSERETACYKCRGAGHTMRNCTSADWFEYDKYGCLVKKAPRDRSSSRGRDPKAVGVSARSPVAPKM